MFFWFVEDTYKYGGPKQFCSFESRTETKPIMTNRKRSNIERAVKTGIVAYRNRPLSLRPELTAAREENDP